MEELKKQIIDYNRTSRMDGEKTAEFDEARSRDYLQFVYDAVMVGVQTRSHRIVVGEGVAWVAGHNLREDSRAGYRIERWGVVECREVVTEGVHREDYHILVVVVLLVCTRGAANCHDKERHSQAKIEKPSFHTEKQNPFRGKTFLSTKVLK